MRYLRGLTLLDRLLAVSAIAAAGMALFASWVATEHIAVRAGGPHWPVAILLVAAGLVVTLAVAFAATRIVLRPVQGLEESMVAFGAGNATARARGYPFTDAQLTRLTEAFNEMADALVEKQAKLAEMSSRVIAAQEEERRRLSREIHDSLGQDLTTVLLGLKRLESAASVDEVRAALPPLRSRLGSTIEGLRGLARALRPSVLDDFGLAAAIRSSVAEFEGATPIKVELDVGALEARVPGDAEIVLYRVFQEAMINVTRHAHATTARVCASRDAGSVRLSVADDGAGFDASPSRPVTHEGVGLFSMAERLALLGGTLRVDTAPGRGTTIIAEVPLNGAA